jgi:hypothetical protein
MVPELTVVTMPPEVNESSVKRCSSTLTVNASRLLEAGFHTAVEPTCTVYRSHTMDTAREDSVTDTKGSVFIQVVGYGKIASVMRGHRFPVSFTHCRSAHPFDAAAAPVRGYWGIDRFVASGEKYAVPLTSLSAKHRYPDVPARAASSPTVYRTLSALRTNETQPHPAAWGVSPISPCVVRPAMSRSRGSCCVRFPAKGYPGVELKRVDVEYGDSAAALGEHIPLYRKPSAAM